MNSFLFITYRTTRKYHPNPWIHKYIFPNGILPSIRQIGKASEGLFIMEDWHNFGSHYDKTLMAWFENFNKSWIFLKKDYDSAFFIGCGNIICWHAQVRLERAIFNYGKLFFLKEVSSMGTN